MVILIKRCLRLGIRLGENAEALEAPFVRALPGARFAPEAKEWVLG